MASIDVGARIRAGRERLGLTQEQFAELLGVRSVRTIYNWESGATHPRNKRALIEQAIGASLDADVVPGAVNSKNGETVALVEYYGADTPIERIAALNREIQRQLALMRTQEPANQRSGGRRAH